MTITLKRETLDGKKVDFLLDVDCTLSRPTRDTREEPGEPGDVDINSIKHKGEDFPLAEGEIDTITDLILDYDRTNY